MLWHRRVIDAFKVMVESVLNYLSNYPFRRLQEAKPTNSDLKIGYADPQCARNRLKELLAYQCEVD